MPQKVEKWKIEELWIAKDTWTLHIIARTVGDSYFHKFEVEL